jgi:hypothetical protein
MLRGLLVLSVLAFPVAAQAQQPCTTDARRVVDELYRHILERPADPGSQTWVDALRNGATVRDVVRELAKSPEWNERFFNPSEGAVANQRAVANLYRHILGRQPDPAGLRMYTEIANRRGLGAVVDGLVDSQEYRQNFGNWGVPGSGGMRFCGRRFPRHDRDISGSGIRDSGSALR